MKIEIHVKGKLFRRFESSRAGIVKFDQAYKRLRMDKTISADDIKIRHTTGK